MATFLRLLAPLALGAAVVLAACGGGSGDDGSGFRDPNDNDGGSIDNDGSSIIGSDRTISKIVVEPAQAAIVSLNGAEVTQPFKAIAHYSDGTNAVLGTDVQWTATNFQVGGVDGAGLYKASGTVGGVVRVNANHKGQKASAELTVKLHLTENPGNVPGAAQTALKNATNKDASVVWAYPYDGTVFPRGLLAPPLMWNGGAGGDAYYVHLTAGKTFELETFATIAPPARFAFDEKSWQRFVDSSEGKVDLVVARYSAGAATVVVNHKWTIAPSSMRGTIYYWANNRGRVMRIKPGTPTPDDFSQAAFTAAIAAGKVPNSGCTMTCHTVSADGSTLISGGDSLGGQYDLLTNTIKFDTGGAAGSATKRLWAMPAVTPDGKYVVQNASPLPGPPGGQDGLFVVANGTKVAQSGLDGLRFGMPAFSPDGTKMAYVGVAGQPTPGSLRVMDFDMKTLKASNSKELVPQGAGQIIAFPSLSPDAKWIVYHRGPLDTRGGNADLFLASSSTPNQEIRLAQLNGDNYPFAAGARDKSWNFEPTFAPVAAGGYFWVVFTARRTYGNLLTGNKDAVKQLWVAAIDQNPQPGQDPSHPAFLLPGQELSTLNMRGYWALDPCKGDGQGCSSGTECCGGYCDNSGGSGPVCKSQQTTCSQDGDKCNVTSDCCNASRGVTCINHVCSEPTPR